MITKSDSANTCRIGEPRFVKFRLFLLIRAFFFHVTDKGRLGASKVKISILDNQGQPSVVVVSKAFIYRRLTHKSGHSLKNLRP